MSNTFLVSAVSMAIGIAAGIGGMTFWQQQKNYEDCVIQEMRGQDGRLLPMAAKLCQRRFKVEVPMPSGTKLNWFDDRQSVVTVRAPFDPEIKFVRATLSFSTKDCEASKRSDFTYVFERRYASQEGAISIAWTNDPRPVCMITTEAHGQYR